MDPKHIFAVFPYLKTSGVVEYRNIHLRSAGDVEGLPADAIPHLNRLRDRFYLSDVEKVPHVSYAYTHCDERSEEFQRFAERVAELSILLAYVYCAPDDNGKPWLTEEHATFVIAWPERVSKYFFGHDRIGGAPHWPDGSPEVHGDFYDGYVAVINNRTHSWLTEYSRLQPAGPGVVLNIDQDIAENLEQAKAETRGTSLFHWFSRRAELTDFDNRLLTALKWYNRSARRDEEEDIALVSLAIAFESLLGLKGGERVTARFKDAVHLLLGPVPRLDSWTTQFYDARSEIVHEGRSSRLMFVATDHGKPRDAVFQYRPLIAYGRMIFRVCARTLIMGASLTEQLEFGALFVTNRERLEQACKILADQNESAPERLSAAQELLEGVERYKHVPEAGLSYKQLFGSAKLLVNTYLATAPTESEETIAALVQLAAADVDDHFAFLEALMQCDDTIAKPASTATPEREVVVSFVKVAWQYSFMYYFALKRRAAGDPT